MQPPRAPKPLDVRPAEHGHRLPAAAGRGFRPTADGRYLHRGRLRHRDPPMGLGQEESDRDD